jgi:hypothetical protein
MAGKFFHCAELETAWQFLDEKIAESRTTKGTSDNRILFISQLRTIRNSLEEADIAIQQNCGEGGA